MQLFRRRARFTLRVLLSATFLGMLTPAPRLFALRSPQPIVPGQQATSSAPPIPSSPTVQPPDTVQEEWVGMYLGAQKIGYSRSRTTPTTFQGKPAIRETEFSTMKINVFGATVEEMSTGVTIKDRQSRPLTTVEDIKSNGSVVHLEATYNYTLHKIFCHLGTGKNVTTKTIAFPPDANFGSETDMLPKGKTLVKGQKFTVYTLDPSTLSLRKMRIVVLGEEEIENDTGHTVPSIVASVDVGVGETKAWTTPNGDMIKANIAVGPISITMVKEPKSHALDTDYISPAMRVGKTASTNTPANPIPLDLADATAITVDKPLLNPRQLRSLHLRIRGIPDTKFILSDARQQEQRDAGPSNTDPPYTILASINAEQMDAARSARLPIDNSDLRTYTEKTAYLDTEDPQIRATARRLRGTETNLYRIASNIRDWVHKIMTPDPSIGVPRSATDIFSRRRGVCRDYATLYTALARSAGVPTRLCSGIVFGQGKVFEEGKFYYHAWAECWVGKWVAFDPTLYDPAHPVPYVDATHIKFAQGDVTQMYDSVSVIGKLKIQVLD